MKQRLAIAQAVMENPDILILDEPMNGLDQKGVEGMRALFLEGISQHINFLSHYFSVHLDFSAVTVQKSADTLPSAFVS